MGMPVQKEPYERATLSQEWNLLWDSRHFAPRGHNVVLLIVAFLRILGVIGFSVLFIFVNPENIAINGFWLYIYVCHSR